MARTLIHIDGKVREYHPVCVSCAVADAQFEGGKCRTCMARSESFWFKRLFVRAGKYIWMALGAIVVLSVWQLVSRFAVAKP